MGFGEFHIQQVEAYLKIYNNTKFDKIQEMNKIFLLS